MLYLYITTREPYTNMFAKWTLNFYQMSYWFSTNVTRNVINTLQFRKLNVGQDYPYCRKSDGHRSYTLVSHIPIHYIEWTMSHLYFLFTPIWIQVLTGWQWSCIHPILKINTEYNRIQFIDLCRYNGYIVNQIKDLDILKINK